MPVCWFHANLIPQSVADSTSKTSFLSAVNQKTSPTSQMCCKAQALGCCNAAHTCILKMKSLELNLVIISNNKVVLQKMFLFQSKNPYRLSPKRVGTALIKRYEQKAFVMSETHRNF